MPVAAGDAESAADGGPPVWKTVVASSISICLGKVTTHPLDTLKAQIQVEVASAGALRRALVSSSVSTLYQGYGVAVLGSLPAGGVYMTTYELLRPRLRVQLEGHSFLADFSAGLAAEAVSCVLWCPVDVVKERLQVQHQMRGLYEYAGGLDAVRQIVASEGVFGLYRAYGATLVAFGPQTAINLALYEKVEKQALEWYSDPPPPPSASSTSPSRRGAAAPIPPWLSFACACTSGLTACLVTTPLDLAKLRMQVVRASRHASRHSVGDVAVKQPFNYANIVDALFQIARDEGPRALFKGAFVRCMVWVPQTAVFLATFKTILARL